MIIYYQSGFNNGVIKFANYLKEKAFLCDPDNGHGFWAIDLEDLEDLVEEFLSRKEYL